MSLVGELCSSGVQTGPEKSFSSERVIAFQSEESRMITFSLARVGALRPNHDFDADSKSYLNDSLALRGEGNEQDPALRQSLLFCSTK